MRGLRAHPAGRAFGGAAIALAIATAIALVLMWPEGEDTVTLSAGLTGETLAGEVAEVSEIACPPPQPGTCVTAKVRLEEGPEAGDTVEVPVGSGPLVPEIEPGDGVRLSRVELPEGAPPPGGGAEAASVSYNLTDFERRAPMLWLAIAFAALVIVFGRLRGALSLLGLGVSLLLVIEFIVPAILEGGSPLPVAIVGAMAVMVVTIALAHGIGPKSVAAMLGTTASLTIVALIGLAFTELAHLTGLSTEEVALLGGSNPGISFEGLLLAGMVIGALGVLDDVTISQSSTVMALRRANAALGVGELYRRALTVGRDHVSATVNTLVLAYVGSALPVLLLFGSGQLGIFDAVNVELIAKEIVATLAGSIGLIAAVPITTWLAAVLAVRLPAEEVDELHGHAH